MATYKRYFESGSSFRFLPLQQQQQQPPSERMTGSDSTFEIDESDIWKTWNESPEAPKVIAAVSRRSKKMPSETSSTLPINVPEKSKYRENRRSEEEEEFVIPPHEFLEKQKRPTTEKYRDLRKLRNAVWEKTGFQG